MKRHTCCLKLVRVQALPGEPMCTGLQNKTTTILYTGTFQGGHARGHTNPTYQVNNVAVEEICKVSTATDAVTAQ